MDPNGTVYKDDICLPAVKAVAEDLVSKLVSRGLERTEDTIDLSVGVGVGDLSFGSSPPLPADFLVPQRIMQKKFESDDRFVPLPNVTRLPDVDAVDGSVHAWIWQNGLLKFIGPATPVTLRIEYLRSVMPITDSGSSIDAIPFAKNYLAYAALVLLGAGRADADMIRFFQGKADVALDNILDSYVTAGQYSYQRRPYYGSIGDED